MRRRALLGSIAAAGVGGCLETAPTDGTDDPADGPTDEPSESAEPEGSPPPEPPKLGVAAADADCPVPSDRIGRIVCSPDVDPDDEPMALLPSREAASLPTAEIKFALENGTSAAFETNFYAWTLFKRADGEWFRIAPHEWPEPLMRIGPSERHAWTLAIDNRDLSDEAVGPARGAESIELAGLGGGEYAFAARGWFEGGSYEEQTGFVAKFRLDGDPLDLEPTADAAATRDGETVTVTTDRTREGDPTAAFVVERIEKADGARRLLPEQAIRSSGYGASTSLRNALPFFEAGVETVRLVESGESTPPFGDLAGRSPTIEYEGDYFRITAETDPET